MYLVIWVAFFQIMFILFSPLSDMLNLSVHVVIAVVILGLAFTIYRNISRTSCPVRIKRITKTTWYLAVFQGVLGIVLGLGVILSLGSIYVEVVSLLHVGNALAIITQASSSATAYDMWEEKEFAVPPESVPEPSLSRPGPHCLERPSRDAEELGKGPRREDRVGQGLLPKAPVGHVAIVVTRVDDG